MALPVFKIGRPPLTRGGWVRLPGASATNQTRDWLKASGIVTSVIHGTQDPNHRAVGRVRRVRRQVLNFFLRLENEYRDTLGRQRNNQGFVDAEGSAVWFPEWLRYVLNQCSVTEATNRVLMQIRGQGIQPVCGVVAPGVISFPPRNQSLDFLNTLDGFYRDELDRTVELTYVDLEGKAVWLQEYLRYRVNGCDDTQATDRVIQQIRGGGIAPVCGAPPEYPGCSFTSIAFESTTSGTLT